jgi:hypothetical protein
MGGELLLTADRACSRLEAAPSALKPQLPSPPAQRRVFVSRAGSGGVRTSLVCLRAPNGTDVPFRMVARRRQSRADRTRPRRPARVGRPLDVSAITMAAMAALGVRSASLAFASPTKSRCKQGFQRTRANGRERSPPLPCRRSWVRVPSSALRKPRESRARRKANYLLRGLAPG